MTERVVDAAGEGAPSRCRQCRRVLPTQATGRPRQFCSQACRQWHWVHAQRAGEVQLTEDALVIARGELESLQDRIDVVAGAARDVERAMQRLDVGAPGEAAELRSLVAWLLESAAPLRPDA